MNSALLANVTGFSGLFVIAGAYLYLSARACPPDLLYFALNILGSALLAVSLSINVNVPSLSLQIFWIATSALGILRLRKRAA